MKTFYTSDYQDFLVVARNAKPTIASVASFAMMFGVMMTATAAPTDGGDDVPAIGIRGIYL